MAYPKKYANAQERQRHASKRRRDRDRPPTIERATVTVPHTEAEKIALYRIEKARSEERNAARNAEIRASVQRALAKADAEKTEKRGGRRRGPNIHVGKADPLDLLRRSRM
jgi:hypothetical protein